MSRTHRGYAAAYVWYACMANCVELWVGLNSPTHNSTQYTMQAYQTYATA